MLTVLRHPVYRRLFAAQALSLLGSGLTTVALGLLAYDLAGDDAGLVLGAALTIKMVAYVGIAPIAGALAARLPRRGFLVSLDAIRAALVLMLPFVTEIWEIYALVFLFQALSAAFTPAFQATIPDILPDERAYADALSLSRLAYDLESLLSPMIAGALLSVVGFHWLFAGNALGFLCSAALVLSSALPAMRADEDGRSFVARVARGTWIYLATPRLRGLLALTVAVAAAGAMVIVNTVVLVRGPLGGDDRDVALFLAAYGLGSMAAALSLPRLLRTIAPRTIMLAGGAGLAATLAASAASAAAGPGFSSGLALWAALGLGSSLIQTPSGLLLRRSSRAEDRPALFSAQFALSHACWLAAYPAAGWLGARAGLDAAFLAMAAAAAGGVVAAARLWPRIDPVDLEHEHPALEHVHAARADDHHGEEAVDWLGAPPPGAERRRHRHRPLRHSHPFVIDDHHPVWPRR